MATEVKHRRQRKLGHLLRMEQKRISKEALKWNSLDKRKQKRPKMTLKKKFERDLKKMELTWETRKGKQKSAIHGKKRSSCIILNG